MPYTTVAPVDGNSLHPTSPGVRVPYLPPGSTIWIWVIGEPQIVTVPITQSEFTVINGRIDALVASVENAAARTVARHYSAVSIKNAETLGINSFPTPVEGDAFYAILRDVNGSAIRTQLWMYVGQESGFLDWQMITDTTSVDPVKKTYFSETTGVDYYESFLIKPGMDINANIADATEGPANFYFIGTSIAVPHDPEIAHFYVGNNLYGQIVWWLDELSGGREYAKCATGATLLQKQTLPPDASGGWIFAEIDEL